MTDTKKDFHAPASDQERRALDAEELELADMARKPVLDKLSERELSDLVGRLRSRRNRARDIADRQGREARSKSAPSGATPASGNAGTLTKLDYLNAALTRATEARDARGDASKGNVDASTPESDVQPNQRHLAEEAMHMKQAGQTGPNEMTEDGGPLHPDDPDASEGKANLEDTARKTAPSGALDHAGELPSRERSRTRY